MASVHLGRQLGDAGFARTVAIKRLRPGLLSESRHIRMFMDEARLAGRIQHANVVTTIDVCHDHDELFLVMEYVHGESLRGLVNTTSEQVAPPIGVAAGIACGALRGLHAAHEARGEGGKPLGIVHRDVSPQNLLVGVDGTTRVVDFGIALAVDRLQQTHTGQLKGKPRYMAPEQLTGKREHPVDRRTDVFCMAIVLWELLAGRRLFNDPDEINVLRQVLSMPIPSPGEHNSRVPPALSRAVMKGLERAAHRRHATARDFARDIEQAMQGAVASEDEIGDWVVAIAGERLDGIQKRIVEIESAAPATLEAARRAVAVALDPATNTSLRAAGRAAGREPAQVAAATVSVDVEGTDTEVDLDGMFVGDATEEGLAASDCDEAGSEVGAEDVAMDVEGEPDAVAVSAPISQDEHDITQRIPDESPTNRIRVTPIHSVSEPAPPTGAGPSGHSVPEQHEPTSDPTLKPAVSHRCLVAFAWGTLTLLLLSVVLMGTRC